MLRHFQNIAIDCWEERGKLGFKPPFVCLQAGPDACSVLIAAVDELLADGVPARRTVGLNPSRRKRSCSKIRLLLSPECEELKQMSLTRDGVIAIFEFTPAGLERFREALMSWRNGGEDFSIHPDTYRKKNVGTRDLASGEVWFWTPFMSP